MNIVKKFLIITRSWSFSLSFASITLGTIIASKNGVISLPKYALCLLGAMLIHAAANTLNDYLDLKNGVDSPFAPTAKYRPHPVFTGLIKPNKLFTLSIFLFIMASFLGIVLVFLSTPILCILLVPGFLLSIFYTTKTKGLKYTALGEVAVFLSFGPLMVEGAYCVQLKYLSTEALLISIPMGMLAILIQLANNLRDIKTDIEKGIKTLGTILGIDNGLKLLTITCLFSYILIAIFIATKQLTWLSVIIFAVLPYNIVILKEFYKKMPVDADARISRVALIYSLLLILSLIIS